jgi:hypothetical protein
MIEEVVFNKPIVLVFRVVELWSCIENGACSLGFHSRSQYSGFLKSRTMRDSKKEF